MYFVYVLQSLRDGKRYVGFTTNLEQMLLEHNRRSKL
ncbi:MAG: GIY-YIG nuclease family protein [Candidatus Sungbacteria bacterium]|uniref:GIY-YIG nuclease family protein n=1 Tax=Candidatus Sungiibacteriota bacterium TaxID=2750080 RepID=A0A932YZ50_9BACT|nr:GIY-YIG nuclease family protein [Candidatus Sungbacteria bacterium]